MTNISHQEVISSLAPHQSQTKSKRIPLGSHSIPTAMNNSNHRTNEAKSDDSKKMSEAAHQQGGEQNSNDMHPLKLPQHSSILSEKENLGNIGLSTRKSSDLGKLSTNLGGSIFRGKHFSVGGSLSVLKESSIDPKNWEDFVLGGTKVKSFLEGAMMSKVVRHEISDSSPKHQKRLRSSDSVNDDAGSSKQSKAVWLDIKDHAAAIAKEKTEECLVLQRKLEEAQAQVQALRQSSEALQEKSTASEIRFERTVEALRIAAANSANARCDANAAEATTAGLASQLEALQTVVRETKLASQVLYQEQEIVTATARTAQARLLRVEADLALSKKENATLKEKATELARKNKVMQEQQTKADAYLKAQSEELHALKKAMKERDAAEQMRKDHTNQLEKELVEASSASKKSLAAMQETILELQSANKELHEQLFQQKDKFRDEKSQLKTMLTKAQEEAISNKLQLTEQYEDIESLRITKNLTENEVAQLRSEVTKLESRLSMTPESISMDEVENTISKEGSDKSATSTCCICFKASFGQMKSCQCGQSDCHNVAHMTCVNNINVGPSVSHPGTPGIPLPVILCRGILHHRASDQDECGPCD